MAADGDNGDFPEPRGTRLAMTSLGNVQVGGVW